jgi:hypothetical protein
MNRRLAVYLSLTDRYRRLMKRIPLLGVGLGLLLSSRVSTARYCCVTKPQLITTAVKEITGAHSERLPTSL